MFDTVLEPVEVSVKAYYLASKIAREDLNCIFIRHLHKEENHCLHDKVYVIK